MFLTCDLLSPPGFTPLLLIVALRLRACGGGLLDSLIAPHSMETGMNNKKWMSRHSARTDHRSKSCVCLLSGRNNEILVISWGKHYQRSLIAAPAVYRGLSHSFDVYSTVVNIYASIKIIFHFSHKLFEVVMLRSQAIFCISLSLCNDS